MIFENFFGREKITEPTVNFEVHFNVFLKCIKKIFKHETIHF